MWLCHVVQVSASNYCDAQFIDALKVVSIPVSLACKWQYDDVLIYLSISTGQWSDMLTQYILSLYLLLWMHETCDYRAYITPGGWLPDVLELLYL